MLTLTLHKNGKKEVYEREDANLIEMEGFFKLQQDLIDAANKNELTRVKSAQMQIEFIASLFKENGVSVDDIRKGWKAKEFDDNCISLFKEISPEDFEETEPEEDGKKEKK